MDITPINDAEAIIDPLWDPRQSEFPEWTVEPGVEHGIEVSQNWCNVVFGWARQPANEPALAMHRVCGISCPGYDGLVLSLVVPPGAIVRMRADTDRGLRTLEAPPATEKKRELVLPLDGATRIDSVRIEVDSAGPGIAAGHINWLGLRNEEHLARMLSLESMHDDSRPKHLKGEEFTPEFRPAYGLVLTEEEITALRSRHDAMTADGSVSPFLEAADRASALAPEAMIHGFVNFWNDSRYNRERDHDERLLTNGLNTAIAAHLTRDPSLLRLAARYALSIAMCDKWDDGFICFFPGSDFEHRCFVQSLCAYDVAAILDLAGECFTDVGRDFLLRRLAEEAMGSINFITWKHEYVYHCNQLAWFTPGRMLGLAVLSQHYPRAKEHIEIAYRDLCESLDHSILPDGGYVEGPTYFRCVGRDGGLGLYYYSRVHGVSLESVMPDAMRRAGDFGEAVTSTDEDADVIPICDARERHDVLSQAIMANLTPGSAWARMVKKRVAKNNGWPSDLESSGTGARVPFMADAAIAWNLIDSVSDATADPPPVVVLPEMGPAISVRKLGEHTLKLFLQGNQGGAGHTHEDKGSFVLELAGETLAMDPGSCDYSNPLAGILKNCERHSMLIPTGMPERPHPESPLPVDVKPRVAGDETSFRAEIDASPGWERYYHRWHRTWDSPSPDALTITDDYELASGDGVEFLWQTRLDVSLDGSTAVVSGSRARATLKAPPRTTWRVDELPLVDGTQRRLALAVGGRAGRVVVTVGLEVIP